MIDSTVESNRTASQSTRWDRIALATLLGFALLALGCLAWPRYRAYRAEDLRNEWIYAIYKNDLSFLRTHVGQAPADLEYGETTGLMLAARRGDRQLVNRLLDAGAQVNREKRGGMHGSALSSAVYAGDSEMVRLLVSRGANLRPASQPPDYLLRIAANLGDRDMIRVLDELGLKPRQSESSPNSPLCSALRVVRFARERNEPYHRHRQAADLLIALGAPIGLWEAVMLNDLKKTKALLARGADPNPSSEFEPSLLAHAIRTRDGEMIEVLLLAGAGRMNESIDVNAMLAAIQTGDSETLGMIIDQAGPGSLPPGALHQIMSPALRAGAPGIERTVLRRLRANGRFGSIALWHAVSERREDIVTYLLSTGVRADSRDDGRNPIVLRASELGHAAIVRRLIEEGAPVNARSLVSGMTPLQHAVRCRDHDLALWLLKHRADPNTSDHRGVTPLMQAAAAGHERLVDLLLKHGARVNASDSLGRTARDRAIQQKHPALAARL